MTLSKICRLLAVTLLAGLAGGQAAAQSTDGYHSIQVFPVVVDTASFAQRFHFRNPNTVAVTITPKYFPATGTTATQITCPDFVVSAGASTAFSSLRALCPSLAAGSQFGFLYTSESNTLSAPYAAFSRVANPQGNGFSVEAFPAHTFTSAVSVVDGIRRMAANGSAPAFQTNCFVGNLNEIAPVGSAPSTLIHYSLYSSAGVLIGGADLSLLPGQIVRLLDVFAVAPAGDYLDARIKFEELGTEEPGIIAFCTVQDNTSFGADFRIAKQELGDPDRFSPAPLTTVGSQDGNAMRDMYRKDDGLGRQFELGKVQYNVHLLYFRHPDYVQCELLLSGSNARLGTSSGLEMRLTDQTGAVLAGGNDVIGFDKIYLGEKTDRFGGLNARYYLRVEDNENPIRFGDTAYRVHCQSGSGATLADTVVYKQAGESF